MGMSIRNNFQHLILRALLAFTLVLLFAGLSAAQPDEVLRLINEVRTDPQKFLQVRLTPFVKEKGMENNDYAKSLFEILKSAKPVNPLKSSAVLTKLARGHAKDMGSKGKVGHDSSDGTTFVNRLRKKIKTGMIAENCDYGNTNPLDIVMSLLIDDGIVSLGHRKNILFPGLKWIGIAIEKHNTYGMNCVMDFAESN